MQLHHHYNCVTGQGYLLPAICDAYDAFHGDTVTPGDEEPEIQPAASGMCDGEADQQNAEDAADALLSGEVTTVQQALDEFNVDYRE